MDEKSIARMNLVFKIIRNNTTYIETEKLHKHKTFPNFIILMVVNDDTIYSVDKKQNYL